MAALLALPAQAQDNALSLHFADGNPYDLLHITASGCPQSDIGLTIDFRSSAAGVLMDTVLGGPGTQDPMPVRLANGTATVSPVADGDQVLRLGAIQISPTQGVEIILDLDDTTGSAGASPVQVMGSEIAGTTVTLTAQQITATGTFDASGRVTLPLPPTCPMS
jgi:hypothetical protein